jgi:ubiquinone/menaquinone biosynthesis C-methylase UbiE
MIRSHHLLVQQQFGAQSTAYLQSAVHATGEDLDALEALARQHSPVRALDLGSGGGHVAYRLALCTVSVTAVDLSPQMIAAVSDTAQSRGLSNLTTCLAPAEALPFEPATFDFLASRYSAHHWRDFDQGLREARRVLAPGSTAVLIDVISPARPSLDTHLQAVELLRDPSHARDYTLSEWGAALVRAGFAVQTVVTRRLRMEYQSWVDRMATPDTHRTAIRSLQQQASSEIAAHFAIEPDGSFTIDTAQFVVVAV